MEISDDFRKEIETIMKKWIKLLHDLDPKFMEMLKMQLDYENRIKDLRTFLRKEVDKELKRLFIQSFQKKNIPQM